MPFTIVCVAPGASEAQVINLANSIGEGWWAFDTLPTTVSEWWRKELMELKDGFLFKLFHWAERITGCRVDPRVCLHQLLHPFWHWQEGQGSSHHPVL